jgi:hypothetical protein
MILKGNQRGGGADLALHLMNAHDNERIEIAEIRGTVADDLYGAFGEFEAIAAGTRCKKPLYSLSINPSAPLTREQYAAAIDRIEEGLGLSGQARAVVFHVKNGREHCHVVWSRVDPQSMRAVHIAHDRMKLRTLSRELAREFGLEIPEGIAQDHGGEREKKRDITLAEKAQAAKSGLSPDDRKAAVTDAFRRSDSAEAFRAALAEKGFVLARGDQRGYVLVDRDGDVHSLARQMAGVRTREIKRLLEGMALESLPNVAEAKDLVRIKQKALADAVRDRVNERMKDAVKRLTDNQAKRRAPLDLERQKIEIMHRSERLALHAAQKAEMLNPFTRAAAAMFGLLGRLPSLRSVMKPLYRSKLNPVERQSRERAALQRRHVREREMVARKEEILKKLDAKERLSLQTKLRRTIRQEELAKREHTHERADQFRTNAIDAAQPKDDGSEKSLKNAWRERKEELARQNGQRRKPAPGHRFDRNDPS